MAGRIAGARALVASALDGIEVDGVLVDVQPYPEGSVQPPAIVLLPASIYLEQTQTWAGSMVGLRVHIVVNDRFGAEGPARLDDLIEAVVDALGSVDAIVAPIPEPEENEEQGVVTINVPIAVSVC